MRCNLRDKRIGRGYTQKNISQKLEISRSTYTNIELGNKNPSFNLSIKIKKLFNYSEDDIFLNIECQNETND